MDRREFLKLTGIGAILASVSYGSSGCHMTRNIILDNKPLKNQKPISRLRVMSYNLANARGNTDKLFKRFKWKSELTNNLEKITELIWHSAADIVGMQEVDFNSSRTFNIDQARYIAQRLGYSYISEEVYFHFPPLLSMGNAVISKYPINHLKTHNYGNGFFGRVAHWFKGFLDVRVTLPGRDIDFITTHFHTTDDDKKVDEAKQLVNHLRRKTTQYILTGDFNCSFGTRAMSIITGSGLLETGHIQSKVPTYPSDKPKYSIDHIIPYNGFAIENYHTLSCDASDHAPLIGDVIVDWK